MNKVFFLLSFIIALTIGSCGTPDPEKEFEKYEQLDWQLSFEDDMRTDWSTRWHLDGERGTAVNGPDGLTLTAGPVEGDNANHMVLWTKDEFRGSLKIEYDFTRLDHSGVGSVNILYLHATGSGVEPYTPDILEWNDRRTVPAMKTYFDHMNAYHISYAATDPPREDYVRARRYLPETGRGLDGTALLPEYTGTGLFQPGRTCRMTVILHNGTLFLRTRQGDVSRLFQFDTASLPPLTEGRIGLRVMWTRQSRFSDFSVYELE